MLTIPCPWCDELEQLPLADITDPGLPFTCSSCGTSVAIVEEPERPPELAAGWSLLAAQVLPARPTPAWETAPAALP